MDELAILAPFAPPLLSEPLKEDAEAQAVDTSSDTDNPDFDKFFLRVSISFFLSLSKKNSPYIYNF